MSLKNIQREHDNIVGVAFGFVLVAGMVLSAAFTQTYLPSALPFSENGLGGVFMPLLGMCGGYLFIIGPVFLYTDIIQN